MTSALHTTLKEVGRNCISKDEMLQAAIVRTAPNERVLPCRSGMCCWRWAARTMLVECTHARREALQLRHAFDEELGDSVLQQYLTLEKSYQELELKLQATFEELDKERRNV